MDTVVDRTAVVSTYVLVCAKVYRSMTSGCRGTPYCRRYVRPGAGFETGDFIEEMLGGATVERLIDTGGATSS